MRPGSGKSTLASGLANFYHNKGKIVKTFESPRDLQVDPGITQYSKLDGSFDNTADILLLVRPDYTIFDEVRRREDFGTFADLRLTGVWNGWGGPCKFSSGRNPAFYREN